jgi:hypothetical protein
MSKEIIYYSKKFSKKIVFGGDSIKIMDAYTESNKIRLPKKLDEILFQDILTYIAFNEDIYRLRNNVPTIEMYVLYDHNLKVVISGDYFKIGTNDLNMVDFTFNRLDYSERVDFVERIESNFFTKR